MTEQRQPHHEEVTVRGKVTPAEAARMAKDRGLPPDTKITIDGRLHVTVVTFKWPPD